MKDSPADQPTVIEVLAAFIRQPTPDDTFPAPSTTQFPEPAARQYEEAFHEWRSALTPLRPDVQAAVTL